MRHPCVPPLTFDVWCINSPCWTASKLPALPRGDANCFGQWLGDKFCSKNSGGPRQALPPGQPIAAVGCSNCSFQHRWKSSSHWTRDALLCRTGHDRWATVLGWETEWVGDQSGAAGTVSVLGLNEQMPSLNITCQSMASEHHRPRSLMASVSMLPQSGAMAPPAQRDWADTCCG